MSGLNNPILNGHVTDEVTDPERLTS